MKPNYMNTVLKTVKPCNIIDSKPTQKRYRSEKNFELCFNTDNTENAHRNQSYTTMSFI